MEKQRSATITMPDGRKATITGSEAKIKDFMSSLPDYGSKKSYPQMEQGGNILQKTIQQSRGLGVLGMLPSSGAEAKDLLRAGAQQLPETPGIISSVAGAISGFKPKLPEPETEYGKQMALAGNLAQFAMPGMGVNPKMPKMIGSMERLQAMKKMQEGKKAVSAVLPEIALAKDIYAGRPNKAQMEAFGLIRKTDNPTQISDKFKAVKETVMSQVDDLITKNNKPVDAIPVAQRARAILDKQIANLPEREVVKIQRFARDEGAWLDRQDKIDINSINDRKKWLYKQTKAVQEKQQKNQSILTSPQQQLVRDAFAQAYKEAIEGFIPDVKPLNQRFAGLEEAQQAASKMAERRIEEAPQNIAQRAAAYTAGRASAPQGVAAAVRELPYLVKGKAGQLKSQTAKIEKLFQEYISAKTKSDELRASRLLQSFINKRNKSTALAIRK
jgi:hypothetical protein